MKQTSISSRAVALRLAVSEEITERCPRTAPFFASFTIWSRPLSLIFDNLEIPLRTQNTPQAFQKAQQFLNDFGAQMNMVYVNTPGPKFKSSSEIDERLFQFFEALGAKNPSEEVIKVSVVSDYSIEKGIFSYSHLLDADIIVMPTHGRKGLSHLLRGSLSENIANHAVLPVLTVKL